MVWLELQNHKHHPTLNAQKSCPYLESYFIFFLIDFLGLQYSISVKSVKFMWFFTYLI